MVDFTTEMYFEFLITLYIAFLKVTPSEWLLGEILGLAITCFIILALILQVLTFLKYQMSGKTNYEAYTDGLRLHDAAHRAYYLYFFMRRTLYILICFFISKQTQQL